MNQSKPIPNPAIRMTEDEYQLVKLISDLMPYGYDGIQVIRRFGDLRRTKPILKSLINKNIVEYDGFDPENICTRNTIRKGINWVIAIMNHQKEERK